MSSPRIVASAVRAEDGTHIIGIRHYSYDMSAQIRARTDGKKFNCRLGDDQGFVDQFNNYYTRAEAYVLADKQGQIINMDSCYTRTSGVRELFSEGVW